MRHRYPWDIEEATTAKRLRDEGVNDEEIAYFLGRTVAGVRRALVRFFGPEARLVNHGYEVGPAIGKTMEDAARETGAKTGSECLRVACLDLFQRAAARRRVTVEEEMQRQLGSHTPARIIRAPYKTASIQRLAA